VLYDTNVSEVHAASIFRLKWWRRIVMW